MCVLLEVWFNVFVSEDMFEKGDTASLIYTWIFCIFTGPQQYLLETAWRKLVVDIGKTSGKENHTIYHMAGSALQF